MQLKSTSLLVLALAFAIGSGAAFAQDAPKSGKTRTAQQERFGTCAKEAKTKGLKGADYKAFMSSCAKGEAAPAATPMTQQEKMTACNADAKAKGLKGKDYTDFRNSCLKNHPDAAAPAH
ncbi:MAG: PsiF family protein [Dokdonella sp.]|uniref:PsiF family protein n=1 Tax=Dokdonella sp. TaxID=2291710 RepID=UPI003F8071AE